MKRSDFKFKIHYKIAIAKKINKLRAEGATYKEISDLFNAEGVETLSGKDVFRWHPQSIWRYAK